MGLVSLFVDMSTEMVYPLIPLYLTAALGASPAIVGLIEGIAESVASLLKVFSGYIGDVRRNKKQLAFIGYSASVVYKLMLMLSSSWLGVLAARVVDRTGKGIRTAPRDALVAEAGGGKLGSSFGLHKMLDMAGSTLGVILAYLFVVRGVGLSQRVSVLDDPGVRRHRDHRLGSGGQRRGRGGGEAEPEGPEAERTAQMYLAVLFVFCLGNSSNAFLLLKAQQRAGSRRDR